MESRFEGTAVGLWLGFVYARHVSMLMKPEGNVNSARHVTTGNGYVVPAAGRNA